MARNEIDIAAPPEAVFDVLADPRAYARWVVGSRAIRAADPDWPAPGSVFDHAQGVGALVLKDTTTVLECDRPRLLAMRVNARPFTVAHVTLTLEQRDGGTHVVMREVPADARSQVTMNPMVTPLLHMRNAESLRRLKRLAEGEEPIPQGELPRRGEGEAWITGSSRPAATT
jgi:uncharacterized protein YndB with AHSA1/START domain